MSKSVISNEKATEHIIESYYFKVLGSQESSKTDEISSNEEKTDEPVKINEPKPEVAPQVTPAGIETQSSFVEELLKKTDELSSNIIKLQMQIENQESEFEKRLNEEIARTKEIAQKEGYDKAQAESNQKLEELKNKYIRSFSQLEQQSESLKKFLQETEQELSLTALEVAKEVVKEEISKDSSKIAYTLAKELMKELSEAVRLEVKVNPIDYEYVKENLEKMENIKISSDDAISQGGVIILSDAGNLDGNIKARFEKIKLMLKK